MRATRRDPPFMLEHAPHLTLHGLVVAGYTDGTEPEGATRTLLSRSSHTSDLVRLGGSPPWRGAPRLNLTSKGREAHDRSHSAHGRLGPRGPSQDGPRQPRNQAESASRGCKTRPRQRTLGDFFPVIDTATRAHQLRGDFRRDRKSQVGKRTAEELRTDPTSWSRQQDLHPQEQTYGCLTQNVNGFGADDRHRDEWMRALRQADGHGRYDVVFLQETHVESQDVDFMTRLHARTWGYRTGAECPTMSLWSPSHEKKGGVAILVDPYGSVKDVKPILGQHWSPHFMAVTGVLEGTTMVYVCIYAPHQRGRREEFYEALKQIDLPHRDRLVVGGDFNCTLDPRLDRSHFRPNAGHESPECEALLTRWGLVDALDPPTSKDQPNLRTHYENTHTYRYALRTDKQASARLDRWYTSVDLAAWVAKVEVCHPGTKADHLAVRLHLVCPGDPIRIKKPARVYPPPPIAVEYVKADMKERILNFHERLTTVEMDATTRAMEWEETKTAIRVEALRIIKQRRKTARATNKQKCRRLLRQERRLLDAAAGVGHTVETITDMMDALTLQDVEGDTPLCRVRKAITECVRGRLELRQRRLFNQGGYRVGKTTKAFYRRLSNKYGDNVIHRLDAAVGHRERGAHGQPDTMADAWTKIFQQEACSEEARMEVLQWLGAPGQYSDLLADIMEPLTEDEVLKAIRASQPGKACGPDRLGNDWYRDFAGVLAPVLTLLFNAWYAAGVMPPSFLEADIFCLKKGGAAQDPLNFRPLSLMNTDYKLLTRILTTRARTKLPAIIHPHQNGFVPLRTIHSTIDLFTAAQRAAQTNPEFAEALALLLDFCKAYDSVDREFLYAVLLWLGFPPAFVAAIRAMHDGTRVRFLANGYRSRWVMVTCGIRQGCPLAPIIFILVLEALYRRLDNHPQLEGIILRSAAGPLRLKVGGYADDTASYVKTFREILVVLEIARCFALASGLRLNENKTMVIALNPELADRGVQLPDPLRLQAADQLSRYLGIQVGSTPDVAHSWTLAYTQLVARLRLAVQKTTTVDQRSMVVAAIVIPKLLYIGRHQWPTRAIVEAFQRRIHNYIWHAQFTAAKLTGKAWLYAKVAALPRAHGGVAAPNLQVELQAMAAVTVAKWALGATPTSKIVGDVLADQRCRKPCGSLVVSPRLISYGSQSPRLGPSLWITGTQICERYGRMAVPAAKPHMVAALNCTRYFCEDTNISWTGRRGILFMEGYLLHGDFCSVWMPHLVLSTMRLFAPDGRIVSPATAFRTLCHEGYQLKDVVHWTWTDKEDLRITIVTRDVNGPIRSQLGQLMQLLVLNFPQLLRRGTHDGLIRAQLKPGTKGAARRCLNANMRVVTPEKPFDAGQEGHMVQTHEELEKHMADVLADVGQVQFVHPHPRLSRMVCLWVGRRRWSPSAKHFKAHLTKKAFESGRRIMASTTAKWASHSNEAATGLAKLQWRSIRRVVGLTPWGEQVLLRLKHHALSTFNPVSAGLHCPHAECLKAGKIDLYHVFWTCPAARRLRRVLLGRWKGAGLSLLGIEHDIFALTLNQMPTELLTITARIVADSGSAAVDKLHGGIEEIVDKCWSIGAALYFHCTWRWRVAHFDPHNDVTAAHHEAGYATRLTRGHASITADALHNPTNEVMGKLRSTICAVLGGKWTGGPHLHPTASAATVVFIAEGVDVSSGIHAGGILIVRGDEATGAAQVTYLGGIRYTGSVQGAASASHLCLLTALRTCRRLQWGPVHVVGDNLMAIRQQATRAAPRRKGHRGAYWKTRRMADVRGVETEEAEEAKASSNSRLQRPVRTENLYQLESWRFEDFEEAINDDALFENVKDMFEPLRESADRAMEKRRVLEEKYCIAGASARLMFDVPSDIARFGNAPDLTT